MPIATSQGSTVSFGGSPLGSLVTIRATGPTATGEDVTTLESAMDGVLIVRESDVFSLEPGSLVVTFLGPPTTTAVGAKGELVVTIGGDVVLSGEAFLSRYEVEASVGDVVRSSASFQLTGTVGS